MEQKEISMEVVNPNAAGVDIGSRSHWAAVGQRTEEVQEFGVFNDDLKRMASWFKEKKVSTVAMESTGTYWQALYAVLLSEGIEVILCNGKFTKNIKGKKTDIKDCQWIQKLHSLGLLTNSFLPDKQTEQLRTYCRQRALLLDSSASATKKMQKYLRLLNLRLDVVVNDIVGQTGLSIIKAICEGESNPERLAELRHYNCRRSKEEIAKALQTNGRIEKKPHKKVNKNSPKDIDLNLKSYQYFEGVDLMAIEGMSYSTVLAIMSEVGLEGIKKFKTAKQFASWLRLAPNNKISGGKILSSKVPKGSNRLKIALRNAANAIGNLKDSTPLRDFFQRINYRKGRVSAISATARKLAVIIWNMVVKNKPYYNPVEYLYLDQKRKRGLVKRIQKQITKFELSKENFDFVTN